MNRIIGPKAATWNQDELEIYDNTVDVTVCLTERELAALLTVTTTQMRWSTRWFGDTRTQEEIETFADTLSNKLMTVCTPNVPPTVIEKLRGSFGGTEEEKEMAPFSTYINDNGLYIIVSDGCGNSCAFGPLGESALDAFGNVAGLADGGSDIVFPGSVTDPQSCYQVNAFDYLMNRFQQFTERVQDTTRTALDELLEDPTGVLDVPNLVSAAVTGNDVLTVVQEFSVDLIVNAARSTNVRNVLEPAIPIGDFNRQTFGDWVSQAPGVEGIIPIRSQLQVWARFANLRGINTDLAKFAQQCNSGVSIIDNTPASVTYPIVSSDGIYEFWEYETGSIDSFDGFYVAPLPAGRTEWPTITSAVGFRTELVIPGGAGVGALAIAPESNTNGTGDTALNSFAGGVQGGIDAIVNAGLAPDGWQLPTANFAIVQAIANEDQYIRVYANQDGGYFNSFRVVLAILI